MPARKYNSVEERQEAAKERSAKAYLEKKLRKQHEDYVHTAPNPPEAKRRKRKILEYWNLKGKLRELGNQIDNEYYLKVSRQKGILKG